MLPFWTEFGYRKGNWAFCSGISFYFDIALTVEWPSIACLSVPKQAKLFIGDTPLHWTIDRGLNSITAA